MTNIKIENLSVRFENGTVFCNGEVTLPTYGFMTDKPHFLKEYKDGKQNTYTMNVKFGIMEILGVIPFRGWWGEHFLEHDYNFNKPYQECCVIRSVDKKTKKIVDYVIDIPYAEMKEWWEGVEKIKNKVNSLIEKYVCEINEELKTCV